jgi:hypothetical protein
MKTKIEIEVESPDVMEGLLLEEGDDADEYDEEQKKEVEDLRVTFAKDLHEHMVKMIEDFTAETLEENFFDDPDDLSIEGWDTLADYSVKITTKRC